MTNLKKLIFIFLAFSAVQCSKQKEPAVLPALLSPSSVSFLEGSNNTAVVFKLDQAASSLVSFTVSSREGSALNTKDFTPIANKTVSFSPGQTEVSLPIEITNDSSRYPDRSFFLDLKDPSGLKFDKEQIEITVKDDDLLPEVNFSSAGQVVSKTANVAIATVRLSVPATEPLDIPYTVSGTLSSDQHTFLSGDLIFTIGQSEAYITGNLNANNSGPNKTIILTLSKIPAVQLGRTFSQTIVLTDQVSGLAAAIFGNPDGVSNQTNLNVSISGVSLTQYKYKISNIDSCNQAKGYSSAISINQSITDNISNLLDGTVFLCVVGGDQTGVFQDVSVATKVSWTKLTLPPQSPTLSSLSNPFSTLGANDYLSNQPSPTLTLSNIQDQSTVSIFETSDCSGTPVGQTFFANGGVGNLLISLSGDGKRTLYGKAKNRFNQESACASLFSYTLDTLGPKILRVETPSASGFYGKNSEIFIDVVFSKNIVFKASSGQSPYLILNTLPLAGTATYVSTSANKMRFSYKPLTGQSTQKLDLFSQTSFIKAGSQILDAAFNNADLTLKVPGDPGSLSNLDGTIKSLFIDTEDPLPIQSFSDGVYGKTTESPVFTWLKTYDVGGSGILKYQVAIGLTPGGQEILPWTDVGPDQTSYQAIMPFQTTDSNNQLIKYYGSVRAIDNALNISSVKYGTGFFIDDNPPSKAVVTLSQTSSFSKSISPKISWTAAVDQESGIDHYEVAIGTTAGGTDLSGGWVKVSASQLSYTFNNYAGDFGKTYYATVKSVDLASNFSISNATANSMWKTVKPNLTPKIPLSFLNLTAQRDRTFLSQSPSPNYNAIVTGLDLPVLIGAKSTNGLNVEISPNGVDFYSSPVAFKNNDQVFLRVKTPSTSFSQFNVEVQVYDVDTVNDNPLNTRYFWTITPFTCRDNFLYVKSQKADVDDFCVAKYLANASSDLDPVTKKVSVSGIKVDPTINRDVKILNANQVSLPVASEACATLGTNYDLINNAEYNVIANSIENEPFNWDSFQSYLGIINQIGTNILGNISVGSAHYFKSDPNDAYFDQSKYTQYLASNDETPCYGLYDKMGNPILCDLNTWHAKRRVLKFQDQYIWDFISDFGQSVSFFNPKPTSTVVDYYLPGKDPVNKLFSFKSAMPSSWNLNYEKSMGLSGFNNWYFTPYQIKDASGNTYQVDQYLKTNVYPIASLDLIWQAFFSPSQFAFFIPDNEFASGFGKMLIGTMFPTPDPQLNYHDSYGVPIGAKRGHGGLYETQLSFPNKATVSGQTYWSADFISAGVRCVQRQQKREIGWSCYRLTTQKTIYLSPSVSTTITSTDDYCLPKNLP